MPSIKFPEAATSNIVVTDNAALDLPDSAWTICFWEKTSDNTGSLYQYFISHGTVNTGNSLNIYFAEASEGTFPNCIYVNIRGISNVAIFNSQNSRSGTITFNGTPRLWVIMRTASDTFLCYYCTPGGTVTSAIENLSPSGTQLEAVTPSGSLYLGSRYDAAADRAFGGELGHFWQGDFALSNTEIESLAAGKSIYSLGYTPNFYLTLGGNSSAPSDRELGLTTSRNGTLSNGMTFPVEFPQTPYTIDGGFTTEFE